MLVIKHKKNGSTLIETLIYLALFSIIIGGVLVSAYQIIEASTQSQENALIQEEGHFLVAKINWALTGATNISPTSATVVDITKFGFSDNPITFDGSSDTDLQISTSAPSSAAILNSNSVKIEGVSFTYTAPVGERPAQLDATFTVTSKLTGQSQVFSTTKYLRK